MQEQARLGAAGVSERVLAWWSCPLERPEVEGREQGSLLLNFSTP